MGNNRISALRHEYGMNQRELGEKLGVGQTTVSAWEKGKNEPGHEMLHKMAQLFRCSIGYLTGYENDERTRGLTQEERDRYWMADQFEKDMQKYEAANPDGGMSDEEIEDILDQGLWREYKAWLPAHPGIFYEAFAINKMCEALNTTQRKCLLDIARSYEQGING